MRSFHIVAAVAAMLAPSSSSAAELIVTYYGTVVSGFDNAGDFGSSNTSLKGKQYVATFAFTPSDRSYFEGEAKGWNGFSSPSYQPLVSASLSIDGVEFKLPQADYSGFSLYRYSDTRQGVSTDTSTYRYEGSELFYTFLATNSIVMDKDFPLRGNASFETNSVSGDMYYSRKRYEVVPDTYGSRWDLLENYSSATLRIEKLSIQSTGALPEPSTWMFMILGFGAVGYTIRRQKVAVRYA